MKKIPALFGRGEEGQLTREYHPAAWWVLAGEGVATRKWDGTAVAVQGGRLYARYDAKRGKTPPPDFIPCQDPDPITGHHPGWVPADRPCDKWIRAAATVAGLDDGGLPDGTYEAVGPKIGGNPEGYTHHDLISHGLARLDDVPTDWDGLVAYFEAHDVEGVVWWRDPGNPDCDKVKITAAALGLAPRQERFAAQRAL